jgi:N-acetylglutamate synthase-like GNAT family acetyltransferase
MSAPALQVSSDPSRLDVALIHAFLVTTYWASGRSRETVEQAIRHSVCFGGYLDSGQVAFGRIVTDKATFAYLADIFVLPEWQGRGYGQVIVQAMVNYVDGCSVPKTMLGTRDAAGLYEKFGFEPVTPGATIKTMSRVRKPNANAV